ncbi:MAG TPA: hypothetical protein VH207_12370 [Chthoniobacterales bacterium]|jgi:hypothetical protein|nr:hypothetical protein [Chthoniobacterales bacterium]
MEVPGPPARSSHSTRAPGSGLKLMIAILVVFALLAGFGQWERSRRPRTETATIIPVPNVSPRPSPDHHD